MSNGKYTDTIGTFFISCYFFFVHLLSHEMKNILHKLIWHPQIHKHIPKLILSLDMYVRRYSLHRHKYIQEQKKNQEGQTNHSFILNETPTITYTLTYLSVIRSVFFMSIIYNKISKNHKNPDVCVIKGPYLTDVVTIKKKTFLFSVIICGNKKKSFQA